MPTIDILFVVSWAHCVLSRLFELRQSTKNQQALLSAGFEHKEEKGPYAGMVTLHLSWLLFSFVEWWYQPVHVPVPVRFAAFFLYVAAQVLRLWTIRTLGQHWNTRVMAPKEAGNESFVCTGPYRFIRHPNYLAVIVEIWALPLVGGGIITTLVCAVWNNHILRNRIDLEEEHLFSRPGYHEKFYHKSRFLPF